MRTIPQGARLALVLCAILAAIDIVGPLLPDSEGDIAFGIVAAALVAIAAFAIARGLRWGYIMGIVLAALHVLSDGAAIFVVEESLLKVIAAVATGVAAALLVVLVRARSSAAPGPPAAT
jgi:thiamine transporter ThiT